MAEPTTKDSIIEALGDIEDQFKVEAYERNGNFQVTIANMGAIRDYSKMAILTTACDRLHAAELIPHPDEVFRLSWKTRQVDDNGDPIFRPYPTIWVNQPGRTEAAVSQNAEDVSAVRAELEELKRLMGLKQAEADAEAEKKPKPKAKKAAPAKKSQNQKKSQNKAPESAPPAEEQGEEVPFGF